MKYEEIKKVNEKLTSVDIKGKPYNTVNQRVLAFRELYENGAILTDMISNENGVCVFKATVYDNEKNIISTGHAYEKETSSFINKTSYIENCETSAVGRALAFIGIGATESIASADEVTNAINNQSKKCVKCKKEISDKQSEKTLKEHGYSLCSECEKLCIEHEKKEAERTGWAVAK